jgi:hypothetical protein
MDRTSCSQRLDGRRPLFAPLPGALSRSSEIHATDDADSGRSRRLAPTIRRGDQPVAAHKGTFADGVWQGIALAVVRVLFWPTTIGPRES